MSSRTSRWHELERLECRVVPTVTAVPNYIIRTHSDGTPFGGPGPGGLGYTPDQIKHAYGIDKLSFANGTVAADGTGMTIAIVDAFDNPNIIEDLQVFDAAFGLPAPPSFRVVNQRGGTTLPPSDPSWAGEIALDVEWVHAIAPGASILLVETDDAAMTNLLAGVTFAANQPGVTVVSMSFGSVGEFDTETDFDNVFTTPAGHPNVTFLAATGDSGSPGGYPAYSSNVVAVGGTTLDLDGAGNIIGESGWSGSGGGISQFESQPAYQNGVVSQTTSQRAIPDVAYDADPNTGFPVVDIFNEGASAPWVQFGGTSIACPQWAALIGIADQGRALIGKNPLDGATETLPMLYGMFTTGFNDITTGGSTGSPPLNAGFGYDLVTGMGTPNVPVIIDGLVGTGPGGGGNGGTIIHATPNPVDENHSFVLDGAFSDPDGAFKAHTVTIDWGDKGNVQQIILNAGVSSFKLNHTYPDNAVFTIKATITASGFFLTDAVDVTVNNLPPTAVIVGAPTTVQNEGKPISMGAKVTDPSPLDTFSYLWTVTKNGVDYFTSTSPGLTFVPDDQGLYKAFLSVTDDDGGSVQASPVSISVQNVAPFASSLTNDGPKSTSQPVTISFVNPTDAAADVAAGLTYDFDFDNNGSWDVSGSSSSSAQHTYTLVGNYTAAARIRDKDGAYSGVYLTDILVSDIGGGNGGIITTPLIAAGSDAGKSSVVRVFDQSGNNIYTLFPFALTYLGGARVATGDVNGDHVDDVIVANGTGLAATIKVYDGSTGGELSLLSNLYTQRAATIYPLAFKSGLAITSGDINRDGFADVIVGPSTGAQAILVINGQDGTEIAHLTPFGTAYTKGVSLAVGDVTGDRVPDLIVGQAAGSSKVVVLSGTNLTGPIVKSFNAFPTTFTGGVTVAAGDTDGDRYADIVVGTNAQFTYDSRVRVFSGATNALMKDFVAFAGYRGGLRVATEDLDGDGKADLIVSPGKYSSRVGAKPRILALKGTNLTRLQDTQLLDAAFLGGVWVG